jgi:hypothetical protein
MLLEIYARMLDQLAVMHSRRTRGFTPATLKAKVKMTYRVAVEFELALGQRFHQVDTAPWRVHLGARQCICGAGFEAESAMDAIEQQLVRDDVTHRLESSRRCKLSRLFFRLGYCCLQFKSRLQSIQD